MTANSWRFTVTGTLERSTVWRAAERSWIAERGLRRGSAVGVTMPVSWRCFLIFALIGGAAGCLASCAGGQPAPPATTASVAARQPSPPKAALPPDMPRPTRKPAPPLGPESVMSRPGAEPMAMIGPEAPAGGPAAMPHLLLVDDDDLFRESLGLNLIDEGYEITSFGSGSDALTYLESGGTADVALLDWRMPNLTGLEVLRRMRRTGIAIPVIFLTVLSDDIYEEAALAGGAVDFIDKSRRLPILLKRLPPIAEGVRPPLDALPQRTTSLGLARL